MSAATLTEAPAKEPTATPMPTPSPVDAPDPADRLFRISLGLYNRMIELGMLGPSDPIELLDGLLVKKMPKGPRHVRATRRTYNSLMVRETENWHPRFEAPVELPQGPDGDSSPEPDVVVVRGDDGLYSLRHPGPADIILAIEIADSSVAADRKALRRFGWAGIPTVWIVNLRNSTVEVYTGPSGPGEDPGYAEKATRGPDDTVEFRLDDGSLIGFRVAEFFA